MRRVAVALGLALSVAASAKAQTASSAPSSPQNTQSTSPASEESTRPETTTFFGDSGLWFVPTAEVLPNGKWSVSGYRRGTNYIQGYTNVGDFAGTFGVGLKNRVELFGSFLVDTRIDRDTRPLFLADPKVGGFIDRYPRVTQSWTGDHVGDLLLGAKVNVLSEADQRPVALAVRGMVKVPTGDKAVGVSTGKADVLGDLIVSKEAGKMVEVSGYAGAAYQGQPDGFTTPTSVFRWGGGVSGPSRSLVRLVGELNGVVPSSSSASLAATLVGTDGSLAPATVTVEKQTRATVGLTIQLPKGFFLGGGASWSLPRQARIAALADDDPSADYWDWQVRLGYHPGVRRYVAPPPPPPPPPPAPVLQPPTVKAQCDPCTVQVGQPSTLTATGQDPQGFPLTYRWTAPAGTFATPSEARTGWTAPGQEGPVPATVTVDNGHGGTASDTVTIQVVRPPRKEYTFEDVHFDFDRYSLRPEATRVLDEAVTALQQDATLRVEIEGHTCNIGTAEYNLALGDRRANAVRDYLVSRGISADRLRTVSYGEERPKYDNSREETRRLNRRAALVVNLK